MKATVFLGGGRITSTLVAGLRLAGYRKPIVVHDHHATKLRRLRSQYRVRIEPDLQRAVAQARLLVVAVRPDSVAGLLDDIRKFCPANHRLIAVSLAAGIPLSKLRARLGTVHWARAMPSPVCRVGHSLTATAFSRSLTKSEQREICSLFQHVGPVLKLPERHFDAFATTFSSSHGYHALAALAGAAQKAGLNRKVAFAAAAHALADGIFYWRESGIPLRALLNEAATPGGIAATTMAAMDAAGYRQAVARGLRAGIKRAQKNART